MGTPAAPESEADVGQGHLHVGEPEVDHTGWRHGRVCGEDVVGGEVAVDDGARPLGGATLLQPAAELGTQSRQRRWAFEHRRDFGEGKRRRPLDRGGDAGRGVVQTAQKSTHRLQRRSRPPADLVSIQEGEQLPDGAGMHDAARPLEGRHRPRRGEACAFQAGQERMQPSPVGHGRRVGPVEAGIEPAEHGPLTARRHQPEPGLPLCEPAGHQGQPAPLEHLGVGAVNRWSVHGTMVGDGRARWGRTGP